jgi:SPX domain protein involved in polyphosphate accumulation
MVEDPNLRYERKFVVSSLSPNEIENIIKHSDGIFSEIYYERQVNSLYFDSIGLENYFEHLAGATERMKIRIRWYGDLLGEIKKPILELKIKRGELGKKVSFPLAGFTFNGKFSFKKLYKEVFLKSNLPERLIEQFRLNRPMLITSYTRKYFLSANKGCRITLDKDLNFFKMDMEGGDIKEKRVDRDTKVIEVKYSQGQEEIVQNITQQFPFRLSANSKYLSGMDLIEF